MFQFGACGARRREFDLAVYAKADKERVFYADDADFRIKLNDWFIGAGATGDGRREQDR